MVPSSLREKWPADFELFREKCLPPELARKVEAGQAERAVHFLKLLDDPSHRRRSIIFMTHGAMSHGLNDGWVKLALIYRALYHRKNATSLRNALCRVMSRLLRMGWVDRRHPQIWQKLLATAPQDWLWEMRKQGFDPEGGDTPELADDPLPHSIDANRQERRRVASQDARTNATSGGFTATVGNRTTRCRNLEERREGYCLLSLYRHREGAQAMDKHCDNQRDRRDGGRTNEMR
jgi:hypothetical protein